MTIEQIKPVLAGYFEHKPVIRAYVFGSVARGEANEQSDIDVLVELDYENGGASWDNWCTMQDELAGLLSKKVDLVSANGLSQFIGPFIHAGKKLIYERIDRRTAA